MTGIKSLADELREKIKTQEMENKAVTPVSKPVPKPKRSDGLKVAEKDVTAFFNALEAYQLSGNDKMLIRLDTRTINLLKQLKLAKGIDMNKLIAFSLQAFLEKHSWLSPYIKETLKNTDL